MWSWSVQLGGGVRAAEGKDRRWHSRPASELLLTRARWAAGEPCQVCYHKVPPGDVRETRLDVPRSRGCRADSDPEYGQTGLQLPSADG